MPLNSSGKISIGGFNLGESVNLEVDRDETQTSSLNDDVIRIVADKPTAGQRISLTDLWGKSYAYPSDPLWNNVTLMLKMNGTNDSTSVTDSSPIATTIVNNNNGFKIKTGQFKFGRSSGYTAGANTFLYTTTNESSYRLTSWVSGSRANTYCTVECWLYLPTEAGTNEMIVSFGNLQLPTSNNSLNFLCFNLGSGGSVNVSLNVSGDTNDTTKRIWYGPTGIPKDQWVHFVSQIAVLSNRDIFVAKTTDIIVKTAINGVYDTGNTYSVFDITTNSILSFGNYYVGYGGLRIGNIQRDSTANTVPMTGQLYIDEMRITRGSTSGTGWRYPDGVNFTPPNRPFATNT